MNYNESSIIEWISMELIIIVEHFFNYYQAGIRIIKFHNLIKLL